ncbi:hypothetical protein RR48_14025 [Papilio machaon]|uniref:Uncharacterized protein n=1 Tax=Papilio machaon TaxID=76193 RepID=A0A194QRW9_PAPMA|nr:hypothetical protein RR48_14025 [Papilio machaon]
MESVATTYSGKKIPGRYCIALAKKTWAELKQAVSKEFPDTLDQKTVHEMCSWQKLSNETCLDYMLTMKEMGKRGKLLDFFSKP